MNDLSVLMTEQAPQLGFFDRVAACLAWGVGALVFLTVGWYVLQPEDPLGAVGAFSRPNAMMTLLQAAALAGVTAALAGILAGNKLADVGTFAVAFGIALASLRGATSSHWLIQIAEQPETTERTLALRCALEALGWFAVICVALCVSTAVYWWFHQAARESVQGEPRKSSASSVFSGLAGFDVPWLSVACFGPGRHRCTEPSDGIKFILVSTGVGLVAVSALSAGLTSRTILHGQVCFVVAAAVFIATYVAYRVVPVRSALWAILSVGLMAVTGYIWAAIRPSEPSLPPYVPACHFLRILPIQFIAVGVAAALVTAWYTVIPDMEADRRSRADGHTAPTVHHGS